MGGASTPANSSFFSSDGFLPTTSFVSHLFPTDTFRCRASRPGRRRAVRVGEGGRGLSRVPHRTGGGEGRGPAGSPVKQQGPGNGAPAARGRKFQYLYGCGIAAALQGPPLDAKEAETLWRGCPWENLSCSRVQAVELKQSFIWSFWASRRIFVKTPAHQADLENIPFGRHL